MARTFSTMIELGSPAPDFKLPDPLTTKTVQLADFASSPLLLVMFLCNHCPFVKHVRDEVARLAKDFQSKGVAVVAISSNDITTHPDDSPAKMAEEAKAAGYTFPYLYDESQSVAKAFKAACTPDFFVYDRARKLAYRGQLDDSRPTKYLDKPIPVTGTDLRAALDTLLAGKPAPANQKPSMGCNIKWKQGNEPDYFK